MLFEDVWSVLPASSFSLTIFKRVLTSFAASEAPSRVSEPMVNEISDPGDFEICLSLKDLQMLLVLHSFALTVFNADQKSKTSRQRLRYLDESCDILRWIMIHISISKNLVVAILDSAPWQFASVLFGKISVGMSCEKTLESRHLRNCGPIHGRKWARLFVAWKARSLLKPWAPWTAQCSAMIKICDT